MDETKPRRAWWRKKRWRAAAALWLLVAYPVSGGPAALAVRRGWLPDPAFMAIYSPFIVAEQRTRPFTPFGRWARTWYRMAR